MRSVTSVMSSSAWTVARQTLLSMAFSRKDYWSGLPCPSPGDLPDSGIRTGALTSSALAGGFLPPAPPGKPKVDISQHEIQDDHCGKLSEEEGNGLWVSALTNASELGIWSNQGWTFWGSNDWIEIWGTSEKKWWDREDNWRTLKKSADPLTFCLNYIFLWHFCKKGNQRRLPWENDAWEET